MTAHATQESDALDASQDGHTHSSLRGLPSTWLATWGPGGRPASFFCARVCPFTIQYTLLVTRTNSVLLENCRADGGVS